jgi:hypothetical protein
LTDRFVRRVLRIGERLAAQPFFRARQRRVRDRRREPRFGELAFAGGSENRLQRRRRAVGLDIAIRQKHRADALRIAQNEQLRHRAPAVIGDEIDLLDRKRIEQRRQHFDLCARRAALPRRDLRESQSQEIGRHAAPLAGEPIERTAPLKAAEREAVQEQRRVARAALDIRDLAELEWRESPGRAPGCSISCFAGCCSRAAAAPRTRGACAERARCEPADRRRHELSAMHVTSPCEAPRLRGRH